MTQQSFISNESGAVTVDWVVLTAALVGLGLAVMGVISTGVEQQSNNIDTQLSSGTIIRTAFTGNASAARNTACDAYAAYGSCNASLDQAALQGMSLTDLKGVEAVDYTTDLAKAFDSNGMTQNSDGEWLAKDGSVDAESTLEYSTAAQAETSQNALIKAEQAARVN